MPLIPFTRFSILCNSDLNHYLPEKRSLAVAAVTLAMKDTQGDTSTYSSYQTSVENTNLGTSSFKPFSICRTSAHHLGISPQKSFQWKNLTNQAYPRIKFFIKVFKHYPKIQTFQLDKAMTTFHRPAPGMKLTSLLHRPLHQDRICSVTFWQRC
ncbi:hypothetical protein Ancab_002257 [Ancistrocladus abbreviatus]